MGSLRHKARAHDAPARCTIAQRSLNSVNGANCVTLRLPRSRPHGGGRSHDKHSIGEIRRECARLRDDHPLAAAVEGGEGVKLPAMMVGVIVNLAEQHDVGFGGAADETLMGKHLARGRLEPSRRSGTRSIGIARPRRRRLGRRTADRNGDNGQSRSRDGQQRPEARPGRRASLPRRPRARARDLPRLAPPRPLSPRTSKAEAQRP
jgi:hypothetical protein